MSWETNRIADWTGEDLLDCFWQILGIPCLFLVGSFTLITGGLFLWSLWQ